MYIAIRTDDGRNTGKISFYCNTLQVSRQAFYDYLERKGKPWKYQPLADAMLKIHDEDEENADYGRVRMYQALKYRKEVGKLYVLAIFDCYDLLPIGLAMADHMRAELCCETMKHANLRIPQIRGAMIHSDRGSQYTSAAYRAVIQKYGIVQSMNSAGGRCHDNARCESIWARMKEELFYHRGRKTEHYKIEELKFMVWRYFMSYWSNRRICSAIGGIPPAVKRQRFYAAVAVARFAS